MSSNDPETLSLSRVKRLTALGATSKELNGVRSVTLPTGKVLYAPTETVKELSWNHETKQYEVYVPKKQSKQLNLEI